MLVKFMIFKLIVLVIGHKAKVWFRSKTITHLDPMLKKTLMSNTRALHLFTFKTPIKNLIFLIFLLIIFLLYFLLVFIFFLPPVDDLLLLLGDLLLLLVLVLDGVF